MQTIDDTLTKAARFLLLPSIHPDNPAHVDVVETHISWVFLTERFAYKLKKPVRFDFLDFSTVELRKHACQQELKLNQRFSPSVYLAVVPITERPDGSLRLGGKGRAIDFVVKMRRLDAKRTLDAVIRRGGLTQDQVDRLAERLARFYVGQAPVMLRTEEYRNYIAHHVSSNLHDLLEFLPDRSDDVKLVSSMQSRYLCVQAERFDDRVCDGRIVDGHGDLRPEHIYVNGEPLVIDCIEFNDEYRRNDIVDDLGFLAMECDRLQAPDVGHRILKAYQELSQDKPSARLIDYYKCYRACVRAKVAALRSAQFQGKRRQLASVESRHYLELAQEYAGALGPRLMLLVGGLSGSGKSTLAEYIAHALSGELLQTDVIRRSLFAADGKSKDTGHAKYAEQGRAQVYAVMLQQAEQCFIRSGTVVLDGTFSSQSRRQLAASCANRVGACLLQVQCICPREVALQRIAERIQRGNSASEARPELYDSQSKDYEPPLSQFARCDIDTTKTLNVQVSQVLERIRPFLN